MLAIGCAYLPIVSGTNLPAFTRVLPPDAANLRYYLTLPAPRIAKRWMTVDDGLRTVPGLPTPASR